MSPDISAQTFQELSTNSKGGMLIVVFLILVLTVIAFFVYNKSSDGPQAYRSPGNQVTLNK